MRRAETGIDLNDVRHDDCEEARNAVHASYRGDNNNAYQSRATGAWLPCALPPLRLFSEVLPRYAGYGVSVVRRLKDVFNGHDFVIGGSVAKALLGSRIVVQTGHEGLMILLLLILPLKAYHCNPPASTAAFGYPRQLLVWSLVRRRREGDRYRPQLRVPGSCT